MHTLPGALALFVLLAGCVIPQRDAPREMLDEQTGTTVTAMGTALEFYAARPEFGLQAASFAHLGALELNQMGARRLLLWLSVLPGEGAEQAEVPDQATGLTIRADGRDYRPAVVATSSAELDLSAPPFKRPAQWARDGYYGVTLQELREFHGAAQLSTMTWTNLTTLVVRFSEDVTVEQGDLALWAAPRLRRRSTRSATTARRLRRRGSSRASALAA
ncbi:MAG: hypothetical protein HC872_03690, partial [Gammaproteobacteria bacterium]|nr:hypothetical protein [Gammaproteobacteria bacterium]